MKPATAAISPCLLVSFASPNSLEIELRDSVYHFVASAFVLNSGFVSPGFICLYITALASVMYHAAALVRPMDNQGKPKGRYEPRAASNTGPTLASIRSASSNISRVD